MKKTQKIEYFRSNNVKYHLFPFYIYNKRPHKFFFWYQILGAMQGTNYLLNTHKWVSLKF